MTYMNESGKAVAAWLDWLKLTPADLLVIVDDVALPLGPDPRAARRLRGGHNGLKSMETHLGTDAYARVALRGRTRCRPAGRWRSGCSPVSAARRKTRVGRDDRHGPPGD